MTPWWKACALLPVHLMLSCTCHHPVHLWGCILQVEWPLFSRPAAGLQPVVLLQSAEAGSLPFHGHTHTHITHVPGPKLSLCFKDLWHRGWGVFLQGKGFRGRGLLVNDLYLNSWRMGVQEEENLVERYIAMDEDRRRDSRDRVQVSVGRCTAVTREVNMVYHGGWRPI